MKAEVVLKSHELSKLEILKTAGLLGGICYMPDNFELLKAQSSETKISRAESALLRTHHSIAGHTYVTIYIEDIPKIIVMMLNNEKCYNTSEKSARYTKMANVSEIELKLYNKWLEIFELEIKERYPEIDEKQVIKLAQENARYLTSVFTPTSLAYTASIQQWNYIIDWCEGFSELEYTKQSDFYRRIAIKLKDLANVLKPLVYIDEIRDVKGRSFSLIGGLTPERVNDVFKDVYSTSFDCSMTMLAQDQRHRTINYEMFFDGENPKSFYTPAIIRGNSMISEYWYKDMEKVSHLYPQGMIVNVREKGTLKNFLLKCSERMCGRAQLEIYENMVKLHMKYSSSKDLTERESNLLASWGGYTKCSRPGFKCKEPCIWGKDAINRLI